MCARCARCKQSLPSFPQFRLRSKRNSRIGDQRNRTCFSHPAKQRLALLFRSDGKVGRIARKGSTSSNRGNNLLVILTLWRRERDSNPRYPFEHNGFQDRRFQPLTHPSAAVTRFRLYAEATDFGCRRRVCVSTKNAVAGIRGAWRTTTCGYGCRPASGYKGFTAWRWYKSPQRLQN
jgi:hypothetical protein